MLTLIVQKLTEIPRALMVWMTIIAPIVAVFLTAHVDRPAPQARMFAAAQAGNVSSLESSLTDGGKIDARDDTGFTPLMIAARAGRLQAVSHLLDCGADIDAQSPIFGSPLMLASLYGHTEIVELLLAHHANITQANEFGRTALDFAVMGSSAPPQLIAELMKAQGLNASAEQVERARQAVDIPRHSGAADRK
jgi:ankyrin repeat protein